ncbi:hypothetical protein Cgig2_027474 [Carnegiea gigantea]|uniref:Uncharacterized protein n=1 Tax=Carnegiea gigantea TaxID=171969 RepID=A0A9Q1KNK4_9CARY|nr:hypothetical protein Cgig2_027474 [Carnegiea gigantea]
MKRKSYFQCFTFDFFSMVIMKPSLLFNQYHPKSPVSLGALWMVCTRLNVRAVQVRLRSSQVVMKEQTLCHDDIFNHRMKGKPETVIKSRTINDNALCGRLIHCGIRLGDYEGIPGKQKLLLLEGRPLYRRDDLRVREVTAQPILRIRVRNSGPSATISATNPSGARPFLLSTNLPGANGPSGDEELNELLDQLSEEELDEAPTEVDLELVEATSAPGLDEDGDEQGLRYVPSVSSLSGDLMHGLDLRCVTYTSGLNTIGVDWTKGSAWFKKGNCIGNLFGFPTLILSGDARHHPTIDKGREARELRVLALDLGLGQPFRNVPT